MDTTKSPVDYHFQKAEIIRALNEKVFNQNKRAKSTFSMSFSNKVKYNSSGVQRLDLDIQFGQGSISLRSTTVWNRQSSRTSGAAYQVPNSFMDATLRINTQLTSNEKFCKNGNYLDFPYTGNTDEFSHVISLLPSLHAGGKSYSLLIPIF